MLEHNIKMKKFLAKNGIKATPKYLSTGSLKGTWRLYNRGTEWSEELMNKFIALGFKDFEGKELSKYSGQGREFSVFVQYYKSL